jgi:hypothetical protein
MANAPGEWTSRREGRSHNDAAEQIIVENPRQYEHFGKMSLNLGSSGLQAV